MQQLHLNNIYTLYELKTTSELYYVSELAKYLEKEGYNLDLEGIAITDEGLFNSDYYRIMRNNSNIIGMEHLPQAEPLNEEEPVLKIDVESFIDNFTFITKTPAEWAFNVRDNHIYLSTFYMNEITMSLVAYITVHRVLHGVPKRLHLSFESDYICQTKTFTRWRILGIYSIMRMSKALESWVKLSIPTANGVDEQISYEAYKYEIKNKKLVTGFIPAKDKYKLFNEQFVLGDICFLYSKVEDKGSSEDDVRTIESCHIARIDKISKQGVTFTLFYVTSSILDEIKIRQTLPDKVRALYETGDLRTVRTGVRNLDWLDLGVDYLVDKEFKFVTDLDSDDTVDMWFKKDSGEEIQLTLSSPDGVYAILKERNIEFDEERFMQKYFSETPSTYKRVILENK